MTLGICDFIVDWIRVIERRFKLAQILFILSVTLGWYVADGYRRGLFVAALLLLDKETRKINVRSCWSGLSKFAGYSLLALGLWVIFVPAICGIEPLSERLSGMARPIEIFLYCVGTVIFAKDDFFDRSLIQIAIITAVCWFLFVFAHRGLLSFSTDRQLWIFRKHASFAGIVLVSLLPWLLCAIYDIRENKYFRYICVVAFPFALAAILVTYYRTIWMAAIVQIALSAPLAYYAFNLRLSRIFKLSVIFVAMLAMLTLIVSTFGSDIKTELRQNVKSFLWMTSNFDRFTSQRLEIWEEAAHLINNRKLGGFGWIDYNDMAGIKKAHPHSSYLQAGFHAGIPAMCLYVAVLCAFEILAIRYIFKRRNKGSPVVFVVALMIVGTMIGGLAESYFFTSREYLIPFWSALTLLVSPYYVKNSLRDKES